MINFEKLTFKKVIDWMLKNGVVIFAVLTAFFYAISATESHGYYSQLKLHPDMMERSFHQVLYSGFVTIIVPTVKYAFYILFIFMCFVLIKLMDEMLLYNFFSKNVSKLNRNKKKNLEKQQKK